MGLFLSLILIGSLIMFYSRRTGAFGSLGTSKDKLAHFTGEQRERELLRRAEFAKSYSYRPGTPRFHRSAIPRFAPYAAVFLLVFGLVASQTQDLLPLVLMGSALWIFGLFVFHALNLQERALFHRGLDAEAFVEASRGALEEFTIPDDWIRKYL